MKTYLNYLSFRLSRRNILGIFAIIVLVAMSWTASAATLSSISCAGSTYTGSSLDNCTVSLKAKTSYGTYVALKSNNSAVGVPFGVTVSRGMSTAPFTAMISTVTAPQTATITATAGGISKTFSISLSPAQTPALKLSSASLNFGNVTLGSGASQTLTVTAMGSVPIYVTSGSITGSGFSVTGASAPATLNPGQTVVLTVQFNPTIAGPVSGQITIISSNAPTVSIVLAGNGAATAPKIGGLSCSQNAFTGAGSTSCSVTLSSAAPAGGQAVALSSSAGALTVPSSIVIPAGASAASFTASAASVSTSQSATITASANSSAQSFGIQLNAFTPALTLSSTSLPFGNVSLGTAVSKSITVTSTGTAPVTITSGAISGTGFSVTGLTVPATLNPGQAVVISIQFNPTSTASVTGQLIIQSNAPAISIGLSGTGTSVVPTVSTVNCSSVSITGTLNDACTVVLTGSAPAGGVTVALSSSSGSVVVPASITVPATATSAGFVANIASVSTAQAATLTAAAGGTSKTVALQLNAAASSLSANATSVPFGAVVVNTPTTQTVILSSTGAVPVTVSSIAVSGSGFSVSGPSMPVTVNPGQSISVTLTFNPQITGSVTGLFTVTSDSTSTPTISIALSGTGNPHRVDLSWTSPNSPTDPVVSYNIYRSPHGSNSFGRLNGGANGQTAYSDSSVQSGASYDYYVKSVDSVGSESVASNTTTVSIP